ncbi:MAG: 23S rRNA methyltransferase [Chloroflexi bacterium GWB2_49_20]|nr:MAG: 23S rRNA methyltransferase [Chloroflexi bacterium GWB2_49_20]OGN80531.1 MAG: 23S rRNA methyltransferase [Chloroflexi bacterium GWC2_49_37]OGN83366.1 MAG: 23S rRNA methyltransferase [Chloroflexi bacterium GWD2_49_16]HCC78143.1 23S rRNA (cytosine(1962)-C(5))-methyltransferase RlmI [Anaerolineae bacterium]
MPALIIKPGREKSLRRHHPWIFSGAIEREVEVSTSGQTVELLSSQGEFLAQAAYSPHSQIRARVWTYEQDEKVDVDFFRKRITTALSVRQKLGLFTSNPSADPLSAYRLIHAESDGLPGLIVDRYANCLVTQFLTAGVEYWKETLADLLVELTGIGDIYDRSDAEVRQLEGLPAAMGPLRGSPSDQILITENGLTFKINISQGHKTGFYLDQRLNRLRVRSYARGCDVLDCFCYTGGFTINALAGGAKTVLALDASAEALELAGKNIALNDLPLEKVEFMEGDVFHSLRKFRDARKSFDMIILDPPKFAQTQAQVERAARGYKDINLLAFKLLRPGGVLVTFSCSGGISPDLFQKIVAGAALDAGVNAQIVEVLSQAGDHPVSLNFPEGAYLKGLVCIKP